MFLFLFILLIYLINFNLIKFNEDLLLNLSMILFFITIYISLKSNIKIFKFFNIFKIYWIYRFLFRFNFYYIKEYLYMLFIKKSSLIKLKYKLYNLYKNIFNKLYELFNSLKYIFIFNIILKINIYFKLLNKNIIKINNLKINDFILFF